MISEGERNRVKYLIKRYRGDYYPCIPNPCGGFWWSEGDKQSRKKYLKYIIKQLKNESK